MSPPCPPRLIFDNSLTVAEKRLKFLVRARRKPAPLAEPFKKLSVVRNLRRQPRKGDVVPVAVLLSIAQKLFLEGHISPHILKLLQCAVYFPHMSRAYLPHAEIIDLRDNTRMPDAALIQRIRDRLQATGKSANAISLESGLGRDAVRNILAGKSGNPRHKTLQKLAKPFECSFHWLSTGKGVANPNGDGHDELTENELLSMFRQMSQAQRDAYLNMGRALTAPEDAQTAS